MHDHLLKVIWMNASFGEFLERDNLPRLLKIVSVGMCVEESDDALTLAQDVLSSGDLRGVITIPRRSILTVTDLVEIGKEVQLGTLKTPTR